MQFLKNVFVTLLIVCLYSCKDNTATLQKAPQQQSSKTDKKKDSKLFSDVFEFVNYNDDGDYQLINFRKNAKIYSFINDTNDDRTLLRGDKVEVHWKMDTIYIAGDGETPELAEWLVSFKKIKEGKLSQFRKTYKKEFKYHWFNENEYSEEYLKQLYTWVEYYVANSDNELLKAHLEAGDALEYSIEQQEREGKTYTLIGLGTSFEGRMTKIKWLYYDAEKDDLYAYDLGNDILVLFP
ncbi:hypothetical protein [Flavobacterium covae]|uniref:hypothetical protein n=1 Tax=Flavobacterium covae TaxID=2906076 RepID=UPI0035E422C6